MNENRGKYAWNRVHLVSSSGSTDPSYELADQTESLLMFLHHGLHSLSEGAMDSSYLLLQLSF